MLFQPSAAYIVLLVTPMYTYKYAFGRRKEVYAYCERIRAQLLPDDSMVETTYGYRIVARQDTETVISHIIIISQVR